jgi:hypothetical protein
MSSKPIYETSEFKRVISSLNNFKGNNSYFVVGDYVIIKDLDKGSEIVLKKVKRSENTYTYVIADEDSRTIFERAGYIVNQHKQNPRPKVNYVSKMTEEFNQLLKEDQVTVDVNIPDKQSDIESKLQELYLYCFGKKSSSKESAKVYLLGKLYFRLLEISDKENIVCFLLEKNSENSENSENSDMHDSNKIKNRKYQITRNLKGVERFLKYSDRLPKGVYKLIKTPITSFVKITNAQWKELLKVVDPHEYNLSVEDNDGNNSFFFFIKNILT